MNNYEIEEEQFLIGKSCGRLCAIDKLSLVAVFNAEKFICLNYLPKPLTGIGQYSGRAIIVADMGQLLGLKRNAGHIAKFWVVVSERDQRVVLQLDAILGFENLTPQAAVRKNRLFSGSFTLSGNKSGDIINVSRFLDTVFSAADGWEVLKQDSIGVSGLQVQKEIRPTSAFLRFLVDHRPFSIDLSAVLKVELVRNQEFIGSRKNNGTGTIIFDGLVCPYIGSSNPTSLMLTQFYEREDQDEKATRVIVIGVDRLAEISHVSPDSIYVHSDSLTNNKLVETEAEGPIKLLAQACMSSFREHGKSFKIIELERLTSFEFIQEHAPRPNLRQTQNRDSDIETGFLKIPTKHFDLLLAFSSLKKVTSMDTVNFSTENSHKAFSHVEISGEVMAAFNLMDVLGLKEEQTPTFLAVLKMGQSQVALKVPELSTTFLQVSSVADGTNYKSTDWQVFNRHEALFQNVSAKAIKIDESLFYVIDPHSLHTRLKDIAV